MADVEETSGDVGDKDLQSTERGEEFFVGDVMEGTCDSTDVC